MDWPGFGVRVSWSLWRSPWRVHFIPCFGPDGKKRREGMNRNWGFQGVGNTMARGDLMLAGQLPSVLPLWSFLFMFYGRAGVLILQPVFSPGASGFLSWVLPSFS